MLIYRNDGKLFSISKKALKLAGYHDIEHFNTEHNDYSELFVKRPGYIYNFENFSWLSFLRNAGKEQKRVVISTKDNAAYECELSMETIYPVEFDENTPEFFYQIEFVNLKLANGTASAFEDFEENMPAEAAFEEKILKDAFAETKTDTGFGTSPETEPEKGPERFLKSEEEREEERQEFDFSLVADSSERAAQPFEQKSENPPRNDKPLEMVDFEFGEREPKKEEPEKPLLDTTSENTATPEEPLYAPEISLKIEPDTESRKSEEPLFFETEERKEPTVRRDSTVEPAAGVSEPETEAKELSIEMPDIRKVSATLGLPETMVKAFVKEFVTTYMSDLPEVKAAMVSDNIHIVKKEAFKLKGIAANLRMEPLTDRLEALIKKEGKNGIEEVWIEIDAYMHTLASLYAPETIEKKKKPQIEQEVYFETVSEEPAAPDTAEKEDSRSASEPSSKLKLEEKDTGESIIFDPNEAAEALGLPESLILEFVNDFIEQAREDMKSFEKAYEKGDINTINEVAHKLKGVAANLRIEDMRQLMENVQHAQNPKEVEKELIDFYHKLAALTKMMAKEYA